MKLARRAGQGSLRFEILTSPKKTVKNTPSLKRSFQDGVFHTASIDRSPAGDRFIP